MRLFVRSVLAVLVTAVTATAFAQTPGAPQPERRQDSGGGRMSGEERQRLREDLQRQDPGPGRTEPTSDERATPCAEWQPVVPEQREGIRREMRDANRDFDRRR